jgi:hypothetical protein
MELTSFMSDAMRREVTSSSWFQDVVRDRRVAARAGTVNSEGETGAELTGGCPLGRMIRIASALAVSQKVSIHPTATPPGCALAVGPLRPGPRSHR